MQADAGVAAEWFAKAAEQGYRDAQVTLGKLYRTGVGVRRNLVAAYMWTYLSLRGTTFDQNAELSDLARGMPATDVIEAKRRASEWMSAQADKPQPNAEGFAELIK